MLYLLAVISFVAVGGTWWLYSHPDRLGSVLGGVGVCLAVLALARWKPRWLLAPRAWQWGLLAIGLGVALRLAVVLLVPYDVFDDWRVYHQAGVHMSRHWMLGADAETGGPSYRCFFPPAQVFALGVMYRLFGERLIAGQLLNVVWAIGTLAGLWYLGSRLFGPLVGRVAVLLAAVLPSAVLGCLLQGAEVHQTFWLVAAMCAYVTLVDRRFSWWGALLCGALLGVGALIRPTYLLIWIPLGLHMLLARPTKRRGVLAGGLLALGTALIILPWTARNYHVTGGLIVVSSNGGGNLYSANNDEARGDYTASAWQYVYDHAGNDLELQQVGREKAIEWIRTHPRRFAELAVAKFVLFWCTDKDIAWWTLTHPVEKQIELAGRHGDQSPRVDPGLAATHRWGPTLEALSSGYYVALLLAGLAGVWLWRRRLMTDRSWMFLPLLIAYFTLIHMVFEAQAKYHYSLVPLLCVLAALSVRPAPGREDGDSPAKGDLADTPGA